MWPKVTWPRRGFPWVHACATGSCEISVLVGAVHRKWRQSRDLEGGSLGCSHAQPEVGVSRPFFGCFRICCVVLHVRVLTEYIWFPKSPNRRSLCIYPGLWLALYIEAALTFFFSLHKNTNFFTISAASTGFSKSLVTSVMVCPAHRWMR
jgi:hypothetical protein